MSERLEEIKEWFDNGNELHQFQIEWLIEQIEELEYLEEELKEMEELAWRYENALEEINTRGELIIKQEEKIVSFEQLIEKKRLKRLLDIALGNQVQPYSDDEYKDAKQQGLDLDDWNDYVKYFGLGEEPKYDDM